MLSDERRDSIIGNQRDAAEFPALPNPNETPESLFLAFVIITTAEPKVGITAKFRKTKKLGS